jgi:enoyl-[acyl-carrier protein] reductase III
LQVDLAATNLCFALQFVLVISTELVKLSSIWGRRLLSTFSFPIQESAMNTETLQRVVNCVAATTRYPKQILTANAHIENDLGIDSVKRVEIVIALSAEFGVELHTEQRDPSVQTIGDLATWIESRIDVPATVSEPQAVTPEAPATTPEPPAATPEPIANRFEPGINGKRSQAEKLPSPHFKSSNGTRQAQVERLSDRTSDQNLTGRVALVTGSGRGVGRMIARVLAARGATVLVNSFHSREHGEQTVSEIQAQGGHAIHLWGSVTNQQHVNQMFEQIEKQFGLDILVCNASDGKIGSFQQLTPDDWDRAFRTNVIGHHQCAMRAASLMRARGGGSIVTMSAVGAHQYIDGLGSQGVVKAAVESMTRYLACELGPFGIRTNCVVGGPVYGELLNQFPNAATTIGHWESMTPDSELCNPMDLAQTIAFLVSDQARGINGAIWAVDHGFSATADGRRSVYRSTPAEFRAIQMPVPTTVGGK